MSAAGTGFCSVAVRTAVIMECRIELRIKSEKHPSSSSSALDACSCVESIVLSLSRSGSSLQFSSVRDGICALGKAHMRSTPSLRSFSNVAFETVGLDRGTSLADPAT